MNYRLFRINLKTDATVLAKYLRFFVFPRRSRVTYVACRRWSTAEEHPLIRRVNDSREYHCSVSTFDALLEVANTKRIIFAHVKLNISLCLCLSVFQVPCKRPRARRSKQLEHAPFQNPKLNNLKTEDNFVLNFKRDKTEDSFALLTKTWKPISR